MFGAKIGETGEKGLANSQKRLAIVNLQVDYEDLDRNNGRIECINRLVRDCKFQLLTVVTARVSLSAASCRQRVLQRCRFLERHLS